MKGWGIFFVVLGALNLIAAVVCIGSDAPENWSEARCISGIGFILLGLLMIIRAERNEIDKEDKKEDKDKWLKG